MQPTLRKHARVAPAQQPPATSPPPPPADDACTLVLQQVREACSALLNASVSVSADSIRAALSTNLSSSLRRLLASELRCGAVVHCLLLPLCAGPVIQRAGIQTHACIHVLLHSTLIVLASCAPFATLPLLIRYSRVPHTQA